MWRGRAPLACKPSTSDRSQILPAVCRRSSAEGVYRPGDDTLLLLAEGQPVRLLVAAIETPDDMLHVRARSASRSARRSSTTSNGSSASATASLTSATSRDNCGRPARHRYTPGDHAARGARPAPRLGLSRSASALHLVVD